MWNFVIKTNLHFVEKFRKYVAIGEEEKRAKYYFADFVIFRK